MLGNSANKHAEDERSAAATTTEFGELLQRSVLLAEDKNVMNGDFSTGNNSLTALVDSGASEHHFDDLLTPGLLQKLSIYTALKIQRTITTIGSHKLKGKATGNLRTIIDSEGLKQAAGLLIAVVLVLASTFSRFRKQRYKESPLRSRINIHDSNQEASSPPYNKLGGRATSTRLASTWRTPALLYTSRQVAPPMSDTAAWRTSMPTIWIS